MNTLRIATREDFPCLLDTQIACILDLTEIYNREEREAWTNYLKDEGADRYASYKNFICVDSRDQLIGFVSWSTADIAQTAAIECLYVLEHRQGEGIGTLLLQEAELNLPDNVLIQVRSTLNARAFYENRGYAYMRDAISRAGFAISLLEKQK